MNSGIERSCQASIFEFFSGMFLFNRDKILEENNPDVISIFGIRGRNSSTSLSDDGNLSQSSPTRPTTRKLNKNSTTNLSQPKHRLSEYKPANTSEIQAHRRASTALDHLFRPNQSISEVEISEEIEYHDLKQLQRLRRQLTDGILVTRHKNSAKSLQIILGCTAQFKSLTLRAPVLKRSACVSSGETQIRKMSTVTEIRHGTDPDPSCPGFFGTSVLRAMSEDLASTVCIIWSNRSLHLEFDSEKECLEFTEALRVWKGFLG